METEEMESKETTVTDICLFMNQLAPVAYAESWDNPGLLLGHLAQHVHKILVALDLSPEVANRNVTSSSPTIPIISACPRPWRLRTPRWKCSMS